MDTDGALSVHTAQQSGYAVVTAAGSIDFNSQTLLDQELRAALQQTRLAVIVDLSGVDFCDSSGLNVFAKAHRLATARGLTVVVAGLRDRVKHVFALTRLDQAFYPQPDLETAVRWLETGSSDGKVSDGSR